MKKLLSFLLGSSLLMLGCGETAQVQVGVSFPAAFVAQGNVDRVVLRVTAPDITTPIIEILPSAAFPSLPTDTITMNTTVPVGTDRLFEVLAPLTDTTRPAMMAGKVTRDIAEPISAPSVVLPAIPMEFVNFAQDAMGAGDIRTSTPYMGADIVSFNIFSITTADAICASNSVEMVIDFQEPYTVPPSTESHRVVIEFDIDKSRITGSSTSLIESALAPLGSSVRSTNGLTNPLLVDGTEFAITTVNRTLANSFALDVSAGTPSHLSAIALGGGYNQTPATLTICMPTVDFLSIDPDGRGVLNVLSGIDPTSTGAIPSAGYRGNDILYRSGYINYDINLNLATIPGP